MQTHPKQSEVRLDGKVYLKMGLLLVLYTLQGSTSLVFNLFIMHAANYPKAFRWAYPPPFPEFCLVRFERLFPVFGVRVGTCAS